MMNYRGYNNRRGGGGGGGRGGGDFGGGSNMRNDYGNSRGDGGGRFGDGYNNDGFNHGKPSSRDNYNNSMSNDYRGSGGGSRGNFNNDNKWGNSGPNERGMFGGDFFSNNSNNNSGGNGPFSMMRGGGGRGMNRGDRDMDRRGGGGHNANPSDILSSLGPDAKLALTKALFASVLNNENDSFDSRRMDNNHGGFEDSSRGRPSNRMPRGRGRSSGPPRGLRGRGGGGGRVRAPEEAPPKRMRLDSGADNSLGPRDRSQQASGFVQLVCPHCPHMQSLRFKMYKEHLQSAEHQAIFQGLTRKHNSTLYRLRDQQRSQVKKSLQNWKTISPSTFSKSVDRFCRDCKLNYKLRHNKIPEDIEAHTNTVFHKTQVEYLYPHCKVCNEYFRNRMDYEDHRATVEHLKKKSTHQAKMKEAGDEDTGYNSEIDIDDKIKQAFEEQEPDYEQYTIEDAKDEPEDAGDSRKSEQRGGWKRTFDESDDEEKNEEEESYKHYPEDENREPLGTEHVQQVQAYFCDLCDKLFRSDKDSDPDTVLLEHCRSELHLHEYREKYPPEEEFEIPTNVDDVMLDYDEDNKSENDTIDDKGNMRKSKRIPKLKVSDSRRNLE